jgi:hypothetical protein
VLLTARAQVADMRAELAKQVRVVPFKLVSHLAECAHLRLAPAAGVNRSDRVASARSAA